MTARKVGLTVGECSCQGYIIRTCSSGVVESVVRSEKLVHDAGDSSRTPKDGEHQLLEADTKQWLVKIDHFTCGVVTVINGMRKSVRPS
jgi:hypothetical protein